MSDHDRATMIVGEWYNATDEYIAAEAREQLRVCIAAALAAADARGYARAQAEMAQRLGGLVEDAHGSV